MLKLKKGDIWEVELTDIKGHEQEGKRPAIIVTDIRHSDMAIVLPMTKNINCENFPHTQTIMPSAENGLNHEGVVLVYQIRSISKERLIRKIGKLSLNDMELIDAHLKEMLKLSDAPKQA